MIELVWIAAVLLIGSFAIGYIAQTYWLLLGPLLGFVGFLVLGLNVELHGDGGAEWFQAILLGISFGSLVLATPAMLVGIVWGRSSRHTGERDR